MKRIKDRCCDKGFSSASLDKMNKVLDDYEKMKKKLPDLIDDLGWEYDRMSEDGKISLNKIAKIMGLPKFTDNNINIGTVK